MSHFWPARAVCTSRNPNHPSFLLLAFISLHCSTVKIYRMSKVWPWNHCCFKSAATLRHAVRYTRYIMWGHTAEGEWLSRLTEELVVKGGGGAACPLLYMWRCLHHIRTYCDRHWFFSTGKAWLAAKMCCTRVRQCREDARRRRRGGICGWRLLCHWRSLHRLTLLDTTTTPPPPPPPLSSATYSPPALDQLLPMQRFYNGTLSNYCTGCLRSVCVYGLATGCVLCWA